jgi:hypothetical protein
MRIGVIFAAYNCEESVDSCLAPWFSMRESFDLILTGTSGRFSDYQRLGIPNKNKGTLKKLVSWDFDYLSITGGDKLLDEDTSRNRCLDYLKSYNCDLIWLVDLDEFYTCEQIISIIDYVNSNLEINNFWINFKNYTIKYPLFLPWRRPTLYRNNIRGGIRNFYFDSYFSYSDGSTIEDENRIVIPREFAYIDHFSWISRDAVKDKIQYQNSRYCGPDGNFPADLRCAFVWNGEREEVEFNEIYWNHPALGNGHQIKVQTPVLHEQLDEFFVHLFDLDFDRRENVLRIFNLEASGVYTFTIKDDNGNAIYQGILDLYPGVNYWISPSSSRIFSEDQRLAYLEIEVEKEKNVVHRERLHLKTNILND